MKKNTDLKNVAIGLAVAVAALFGYTFSNGSQPAVAPTIINGMPASPQASVSIPDENLGRLVHQQQESFVAGIKAGRTNSEVINSSGVWVGSITATTITGTSGVFSGAVTSDSPTFVVDATNNKVGFGTTTPTVLATVGSTTPTQITTAEQYRSLFVAGQFEVDGTTWLEGILNVTGATTLSSTLAVTGIVTFSDELNTQEASEALATDDTLTVAQSNLTSYVSGAIASSTLPSVSLATSTVYRFVVSGDISGNINVVSAEGNNIEGSLMVAGAIVDCNAVDRVSFIADGENLGDYVELRSDGQKWFITSSNALTAAKLTCSQGL